MQNRYEELFHFIRLGQHNSIKR